MKSNYNDRYRIIGKRIAYYRNKKGWTQDFFCDKIGMSKSYLTKIEAPHSYKSFSLDALFLIADGLGIPPEDLLKDLDKELLGDS